MSTATKSLNLKTAEVTMMLKGAFTKAHVPSLTGLTHQAEPVTTKPSLVPANLHGPVAAGASMLPKFTGSHIWLLCHKIQKLWRYLDSFHLSTKYFYCISPLSHQTHGLKVS